MSNNGAVAGIPGSTREPRSDDLSPLISPQQSDMTAAGPPADLEESPKRFPRTLSDLDQGADSIPDPDQGADSIPDPDQGVDSITVPEQGGDSIPDLDQGADSNIDAIAPNPAVSKGSQLENVTIPLEFANKSVKNVNRKSAKSNREKSDSNSRRNNNNFAEFQPIILNERLGHNDPPILNSRVSNQSSV